MHDLMHDVALEAAQQEICLLKSSNDYVSNKVRHVSLMRGEYAKYSFTKAQVRTFLLFHESPVKMHDLPVDTLLSNYRCLRSLDLSYLDLKTFPLSIGELLHLRYLNVSHNKELELLPNSITNLYNLHTLDLTSCMGLKELPNDLSNLLNLRALMLLGCDALTCMPRGMGKLIDLHKLTQFVVAEGNSRKQHSELEGLKSLKNLGGYIKIRIFFPKNDACVNTSEGAYMSNKEHLNHIEFDCVHEGRDGGANDYEEELLGDLKPHSSLKELSVEGYSGVRMPRWAREDNLATSLPNIVQLKLSKCSKLKCLSSIRKLQCLKFLIVWELPNLEYIEEHPPSTVGSFLASLEILYFEDLPKLKGWWQRTGETLLGNKEEPCHSFSLSQLKKLLIRKCPDLTYIPPCPNLEDMRLYGFNGRLGVMSTSNEVIEEASSDRPKLSVYIDNAAWSMLLPQACQRLSSLSIRYDKEVESLSQYAHLFRMCSSSLQSLSIIYCLKLRSVSGGLKCLNALESLELLEIPIVGLADEEDEGEDMPWGSLHHTLRSLKIKYCKELKSLPKWMQKLTSLKKLSVRGCSPGLNERCQNPDGDDWPNIQHIPNINTSAPSIW